MNQKNIRFSIASALFASAMLSGCGGGESVTTSQAPNSNSHNIAMLEPVASESSKTEKQDDHFDGKQVVEIYATSQGTDQARAPYEFYLERSNIKILSSACALASFPSSPMVQSWADEKPPESRKIYFIYSISKSDLSKIDASSDLRHPLPQDVLAAQSYSCADLK